MEDRILDSVSAPQEEEITGPDEESIKDVFAHFGAAYYHSECLHRELCHICAFADVQDKTDMSASRVDEKLARAYALTLGQVVERMKAYLPARAYSAKGRTPEHRSREAQRAACRSAAARRQSPAAGGRPREV